MAIDKEKLIEYYMEIEETLTDLREFNIDSGDAYKQLADINARMKADGINVEISDDFIDEIESNKSYSYEESYEDEG